MAATIKIVIDSAAGGAGIDQTTKGLREMGETAAKSGGGFNALKEVAIGALRQVGAAAVQAGTEAARAMGAFVADSISAAGDFEAAVNGLAAVTGSALSDAGFSMEDVSAKALQLGKDTQFSAQEAIQAMTELAKGGVAIESVMTDATDATLALASASGTDLATSAEIVAKQLGVWSETGVSAAQVTDLLASAANASTVGVEDLALGLANAGGTAKTAGVSFQDMVQTMALIAPNFSSASDAGTSFKTFISRLIPTTDAAKEAMLELGLATEDGKSKFFDAQGQFVGMAEVSRMLREATAGLSEEQKLLAFNTIFGSDAIRTAAAVANAGADGFNAMGEAMTASGGAAQAAALKNQGFGFAMEQLKGSVETLQIVLGTAFLPMLTQLVGQFTTGLNTVMTFVDTFLRLAPAITESANPLQTFVNVLAVAASSAVPGAGAAILDFWASLQPTITALQDVAAQAQALAMAFITWVTPYALQLANAFMTQIVPAAMAVWNVFTSQIIPILMSLAPIVQALVEGVLAVFAAYWTTILVPAITAVWNFITGSLLPILAQLAAWLGENLPPLIQKLSDFFTGTLLPAVTQIADFVIGTVIPALTQLAQDAIQAVIDVSIDLASFWDGTLKPAIDTVTSLVAGALMDAWTAIQPVLQTAGGIVNDVAGAFGGIADAISDAIGKVKEFIDMASKIKVPSLVTPGSPSPLEISFRGIAGAALDAGIGIDQGIGGSLNRMEQSTTSNNYYYSPTYSAVPSRPQADFMMMRSLATAGT
jgi:TP901 family phage tail tape measure protein